MSDADDAPHALSDTAAAARKEAMSGTRWLALNTPSVLPTALCLRRQWVDSESHDSRGCGEGGQYGLAAPAARIQRTLNGWRVAMVATHPYTVTEVLAPLG